jgi:hypothetical protein
MVFGALDFRPIGWFERALVVAAAIARIETSDGRGIATGFLVNAAEFGLGGNDESLLLTCYYVATDLGRVGRGAVAWFERLGVKRAFKDEVWSSPRTELDACFIRLDGSVDTPPCSLSQIDPHQMDETTPIYVAGHPLAGPLQFSLLKTRWLDYKTPRLHYRASTEAGSGGSAVFDEHWRAIALHRAAAVHMPRLHGTGQYAACEGMSLRDIREAILKSIKAKSARRRPPEAELE